MEMLAAKQNTEELQGEDADSMEAMDGADEDPTALDELPEVIIKRALQSSPLFAHVWFSW